MESPTGLCYRGRMMNALLAIGTLASLLVGWESPAEAMVVVKRDFPALVARAEQIVIGTVTDIDYDHDQSGAPWTLVTFSDLSGLKGDVGDTFTLRLSGGPDGDRMVHVADMPRFAVGERAVLFVAGNGRDICPLVGVWQGRFRLRPAPEQATEMVEDDHGAPVVGLHGRELRRARSASTTPPLTLDNFRQLIADELAHPTVAELPH